MTHSRDDRDPARTSGDPHAVWRLVVSDTTTLLIDLATGEAVLRQEDLLPPRVGAPRPLRREYRARRTAQDSGLGPGWSLTSELPLVEDSATARPDGYDGGHGDGRGDGRDPARSVRLHRDTAGRVVRLDGPGGSTLAALRYDPAGRPVRHTDAEGAVTVLDWDAEHRLTGISDVTGTLLGLSYTASGAVGQVVLGGAEGTSHLDITYPHPAHTVLTDALGRTTAFTFDGRGRLLTVTDPLGGVRSQERDGEGRPVAVVDETGGRTVLEHDTAGRPVARVAPTSARSSVHYGDPDHPRLVTALRDPAGNEVTLAHDAAGRVVRVGAPGRSEPLDRREYGAGHGRLTALVDGEGQVTSYEYDAAGDLVAVIPPAPRGRISYEYDELGRIVAVTGGNGVRTQYRRDGVGRLVEVTGPDGVLLTLEHDALGRVVRRAGTGWHHDYSWVSTTGGSRLTTVVRTDSTGQETIEASYDPDGALRSLATAGGTTSYDYDGAGRLARVRTPTGHTAHFTRDAAGRVLRTDLGGAVQEISYDEAGRRASLTLLGPAGETLLHAGYDYRGPDGADGDRLRRLVLDGEATEFDYDPLGRLVRAGGTTYAYDAAHNLVRLGETAFTIGAAGEVTRFGATEFDYDGAGNFVEEVNPTGSFRYSATNQTVLGIFGGAVVADIAHDGLGQQTPRRVAETTPDGRSVTHVLSHGPLGIARVTDDGVP
ncbi:DUF6531 domain-containing protein, partial [Frankia sp. EI5c]|uniref:DUF6531 domain-containing protein n=1 Tax=Frankia sp. EI5c TaxID=683316 RepID=UPI001F5B490D